MYRGAHRGDAEEGEESKFDYAAKERLLEQYLPIVSKNTEFFSTYDAETLLATLAEYADAKGAKIDVSDCKYKAKLSFLTDEDRVDMTARILKVDDEKVCLEFNRTSGDQLQFFENFTTIKEYFGGLNDAAK